MSAYLDYNASNPTDPRVIAKMVEILENHYGNAHSRYHRHGKNAAAVINESRKNIANLLKRDSRQIIFTSGATESNNLALLGVLESGKRTGKNHIISTAIEHKSILEPLGILKAKGFEVDLVTPDQGGRINSDAILSRVNPTTLLVSVMHVNNETGVIQPILEIGDGLKERGIFFHIDAAQSFGKLNGELQQAHYDFISISGHKCGGPQGVGALVIPQRRGEELPISPLMFGGGQELGLRPGTLPTSLIGGFGKAAELAELEKNQREKNALKKKASLFKALETVGYVINGDPDLSIPTTANISFPGIDSESLIFKLRNSLSVSNGSACTGEEYLPSHVLQAMGFGEERIQSSIRFSWGGDEEDIDWRPLLNAIRI